MAVPGVGASQHSHEVTPFGGSVAPEGVVTRMAVSDGAGGAVVLPSASYIADGDFQRSGADLTIVNPDGNAVVVEGYFTTDPPPDLTSPDGGQTLTPSLLDSFLTPMAPGQYAQALPAPLAQPIGQVLDLEGEAVAVRADGTRVQLAKGDSVYEGDVVETGGGSSAIRMVFTDKTEFSLGTDARLALDQLVFNPDTQSGSAQFSVLKGIFIFASGQIAKSDNTDMTVSTPVATIGIRGTEVAGRVIDGDSQFTIIDGSIEVTTQAGSVTLDARGETTHVAGNGTPPTDPVVLSTAEFGQAYGEVSGVVSGYFAPTQPGAPGTSPGGGSMPGDSGSNEPDAGDSSPGDHADAGAATGSMMLASTLPSDSPTVGGLSDPLALATAFASETTASESGSSGTAYGTFLSNAEALTTAISGSGVAGASESGGIMPSPTASEGETVIAVAPGLDLADGITFDGSGAQAGQASGFSLSPSNDGAVPGTGDAAEGATVQVSFNGLGGTPAPAVPGDNLSISPVAADVAPSSSPSLDLPSTGSSGSPFRSETGGNDPFAGNPYISHPFGYSGPQLGDAVFDLVSGPFQGGNAGGNSPAFDDPDTDAVQSDTDAPQVDTPPAPAAEPTPQSFDITLTVSNSTTNERIQDLTHRYELPNEGNGSFILVSGEDMDLPGVPDTAEIALTRGAAGSVDVKLNSAWDSVKNILAQSDGAGDIRVENFVHADIHFGGGGDSNIEIVDAKRGFLTTGDGNDTIAVDAVSNGAGWSNRFDIRTGGGDDRLVFEGASNGLSELYFDGGEGTDTVHLTGPGQSFDLTSGQIQLTGVERVDISGAGDATLTVSEDLFDGLASFTNSLTNTADTLVVDGDAGDTVDLVGNDWSQVDTAEIDGQSYAIYEHTDGMRVAADSDVQVT